MDSLYMYEPIVEWGDLRVLEVLPGNGNDTLECMFHHEKLRGPSGYLETYTAISYTWGKPSLSRHMLIDGCTFWTTKNAFEIVHKMRQPDISIKIWIDAICINQSDNDEKGMQVRLMGEIYSQAKTTVVYLGEQSHSSDLAFDFLDVLQRALETIAHVRTTDKLLLSATDTAPESAEWEALYDLFARPWFQRVWVIQEIVLSRSVYFLCGNRRSSWSDVSRTMELLRKNGLSHLVQRRAVAAAHLTAGTSQFGAMHDIKYNHGMEHIHPKRRLSFIFYETLGFLASDPRDKVFGILGLSVTSSKEFAYVDYTKSVEDIYLDAAASCIKVDGVPDVLYLAGLTRKDRLLGLPSWVPDFSRDIDFNPYGFTDGNPGYCAGTFGNTQTNAYVQKKKLVINGHIIDKISHLGLVRVGTFQSHDEKQSRRWHDWMVEALALAASADSVGGSNQNDESLWRTLIANKAYQMNDRAPPVYESYFEQFKSIYLANTGYRELSWQDAVLSASEDPSSTEKQKSQAYNYLMAYIDSTIGRRFAITDAGDLGLVPSNTQIGDQIGVVAQSRVPFVLRSLGDASEVQHPEFGNVVVPSFQLIGDCYVHSLMDGKRFAGHDSHGCILLQ